MDAWASLVERIQRLLQSKSRVVVAIDGMSASGKTTIARMLADHFHAGIISMDDFFLPSKLRTAQRYLEPGGNIHYERFMKEIIGNLSEKHIVYAPFDCHTLSFSTPKQVVFENVLIVEGCYSLHPLFGRYYDLAIFLEVDELEQRRRILERNGEDQWVVFQSRWTVYERTYFEAYGIRQKADIVLKPLC